MQKDMRDAMLMSFTLSIIGLTVNFATLGLTLFHKKLRESNADILFLNLIASYSVFSGLTCIGIMAKVNLKEYAAVTVLVSIIALSSLSLDRMMVIKFPFRYITWPKWIVILEIAVCWIFPGIFYATIKPSLDMHTKCLLLGIIPLSGALLLTVSNTFVFITARRHLKEILKTAGHLHIENSDDGLSEKVSESPANNTSVRSSDVKKVKETIKYAFTLKREVKLVYSCFEIVILFSSTCLPLSFHQLYQQSQSHTGMPGKTYVLRGMVYLNTIFTPIVYIYHNTTMRREMKKVYCWRSNKIAP